MAITNNESKTWEKIDKNKTAFQRNNFKNNDYIDTNKKIKYEHESRNFDCSNSKLTTLEGSPQRVGINFDCSRNQLTTLKGSPQEVGRDFDCSGNQLTTLKGAPQEVGGNFNCSFNNLTTLKDSPQRVGRNFNCRNNDLTTLKGAPQEVGGNFQCNSNKIPKEEIIKYLKVAKISREIYTSYGDFENQEEALKELAATNYFPY